MVQRIKTVCSERGAPVREKICNSLLFSLLVSQRVKNLTVNKWLFCWLQEMETAVLMPLSLLRQGIDSTVTQKEMCHIMSHLHCYSQYLCSNNLGLPYMLTVTSSYQWFLGTVEARDVITIRQNYHVDCSAVTLEFDICSSFYSSYFLLLLLIRMNNCLDFQEMKTQGRIFNTLRPLSG